ncbi:MAG: hypothetical protein K2I48_03855 [Muribaculaceae bacterium]|nr:hypothetical protein [Muribaculaceae bacterium]
MAMTAQEVSSEMQSFVNGCKSLRNAIEAKDFAALTDAKLALSKVRLAEFSPADYSVADAESKYLTAPTVLFTPEFAAELSRKKIIEPCNPAETAHLMRGDDYDFKLLHGSIEPCSRITFTTEGCDYCEMALISMSDSNLKFEIIIPDSDIVPAVVSGGNSISLAGWTLSEEPTEFQFVVTNNSREPQTFVIAIN